MRRKHRGTDSPEALAARLVDAQDPIDLDTLIEREAALWTRLEDAIRKADPHAMPLPQQVALCERISAALPTEELRRDLRAYSDASDTDIDIAQKAAFLVGVECGRRALAGR